MLNIKPEKGNLLIAEPAILGDLSFNRAVILLAEYSDEGTVGFILNKPLPYNLPELLPEVDRPFKVYNGGPVEQDNLYFIHTIPNLIPDSIEIADGVFWGGDFKTVVELVNTNKVDEESIRFFLGYSGWKADQLETELESNSWILTHNIYKENIITKIDNSFWKAKMLELGGSYSIWSNAPEDPTFN